MAEIIGSVFGKTFFNVNGVGQINKKTVEGVVGMFVSVVCFSALSVLHCWHSGGLVTAGLTGWMALVIVLAAAVTCAETFSPRSSDNFTIPLTAGFVLIAYESIMKVTA